MVFHEWVMGIGFKDKRDGVVKWNSSGPTGYIYFPWALGESS